jgi:GntR family transcriptional regulator
MNLDHQSPIPLYLQLKDLLASQIVDHSLQPGDPLPSERQLCERFDVSRTTVREALRELNLMGLIRTVPGRGAFVTTQQSRVTIKVSLTGFTEDVRREGMMPSSRLLDARLDASPGPAILENMGLRPNSDKEIVRLERLRLVNDTPLALHTIHLNHSLCPQILQHNLAEESVFQLLRSEYGLRITRAEEHVYAALANQQEMELLSLTYPAAVLRTERTTFLDTGEVIEFALASYCGDWYRLGVHLEEQE